MAAHLYVCSFSNGFVKVGRSADPDARIAQHEARVSCLGVLLNEKFIAATTGGSVAAETALIQACSQHAKARHKNEWFEGLNFTEVCEWAQRFAEEAYPEPVLIYQEDGRVDFRRVLRALSARGMSQTEIAEACKCRQPSISDIATGKTQDPCYSVGSALIALLTEHAAREVA